MTKIAKYITKFRSDIGSFEKETGTRFYKFHTSEYNPKGHVMIESEFRPNGIKEWETQYEYDANQNLVVKQTFYPLEETMEKLVHVYDQHGQKIRDENYFGDDLFEKTVYKYDDKGNIVLQNRMDEDENEIERQETKYDANNKIINQAFWANEELERDVELVYDSAGLCIKEVYKRPLENKIEIIEYAYNEAGKRISSTSLDADNNIIGYIDVEYDEKMNPVKYTSETSGHYNSKTINQITYDDQNRAIENEYFDVLNSFLISKEKISYDDEGNIKEEEIFEINLSAGLKKTHYLLQIEYEFYKD